MNSAQDFESIVTQHYKPLFRFAMSMTRSEADAQDLTQQTFYIWATKGHQLVDRSKIKTWLFTTLHRGFLQGRRRLIRFPQSNLDDVTEELPFVDPIDCYVLASSEVLSALQKMDSNYQAPVALFYLEEYSYKEIATILEIPLGTVKSRITRGLVQLRKILADRSSPQQCDDERDLSTSSTPELDNGFRLLPPSLPRSAVA